MNPAGPHHAPPAIAALSVFLCALPGAEGLAFDPPAAEAGPLRVRIEGPDGVSEVEKSVVYKIRVENQSDAPVRGTVRFGLVDRWRCDPAGPVPFTAAGKESVVVDLAVTPGAGTWPCHYPIHIFAEFEVAGQKLTAHAVQIVEARVPDPPLPRVPVPWQPFVVPQDGAVALWQLPAFRGGIEARGEAARVLATGWCGSDEATRTSIARGRLDGAAGPREGFAIHPPWWGGRPGTAWIEMPIELPAGKPGKLQFETAIRQHDTARGEPPSDGVTFRVRATPLDAPAGALGEILFERHSQAKSWERGEADLGRFDGQAIRLQLESHPGPRFDTTCDQSFWAEPTLVAGVPPASPLFPPAEGTASRLLGVLEVAGQRYEARVWPGRRGLLDAAIGFVASGRQLLFQGFEARVLGYALEDPRSPCGLIETKEEVIERGLRVLHRFQGPAGRFDLLVELAVEPRCFRTRLWLENAPRAKPWAAAYIEDAAAGPWSEQAERIYAGTGNVIVVPEAFDLGFDGHRLATSFVGIDFPGGIALLEGLDVPPERFHADPGSRRYSIHVPHAQTRIFIPAPGVWDAVKVWRDVNGLKAASGVERLAGRFVFDLWGGRYGESARALRRAFRYGLKDAVVVWHNWQRWGYDYRLPDIYPPNPELGTLEELRDLAQVCKEHGVLFAPHDNYIDFYPDAEGYSCERLAFSAEGRPVRAWLNDGRGAQSYRFRADAVRPFVERNVRRIRKGLAPTAYFIDVWSSIGPYDYWTHDGLFRDRIHTRNAWGEVFAWIRDELGGAPQISESGHDQLIGWLDGAQANHLRVGEPPRGYYSWAVWPIRAKDAERVPWFDAAHHDRFVLHGAGYEDRYRGGLDAKEHGIYSDDYMATEMLTGHPAMVSAPFGRGVVRKYWLLQDAARALARRRLEMVEFAGGDIHRQRVLWEGGGEVWVNRGQSPWNAAAHELGPYGFRCRVPATDGVVEAAVERQNGAAVEWSRSPQRLYMNARPEAGGRAVTVAGITTDGACRVHREGKALVVMPLPGGGAFAVRLEPESLPWRVDLTGEVEAVSEEGVVAGRGRMGLEKSAYTLACEPGVFAYRLAAR